MIWRASIMELIGSFALTFASVKYVSNSMTSVGTTGNTGGIKVQAGQPLLEIEAAKMIFVLSFFTWAGFAVSGAHFNPVVSISMFMARKIDPITTVFYLIFQAVGSLGAGALQYFLTDVIQSKYSRPAGSKLTAWHYMLPFLETSTTGVLRGSLLEGIGTFFFVVVYQTMMIDKRAPKGMNCFAVGCAYGLSSLTIGIVTGACINPFIYLLPRIMTFELEDLLAYILGPLIGAVGGAVYYRVFIEVPVNDLVAKTATPFRSIMMTSS